jgi:hypothetical protein
MDVNVAGVKGEMLLAQLMREPIGERWRREHKSARETTKDIDQQPFTGLR